MNCFKFMNVPLPSLPHSTDRLIDAMFDYCRSLEKLNVENEFHLIDENANITEAVKGHLPADSILLKGENEHSGTYYLVAKKCYCC